MCHGFTSHILLCEGFLQTCVATQLYAWRDAYVTWIRHTCDVTQLCVLWNSVSLHTEMYVWHESIIRVTWLNHVCDGTHVCPSHMWHDSNICVTCVMWIRYACDVTHVCPSHMWRDSCVSVKHGTWLSYVGDVTHVWRESITHVTWLMCIHHSCDMTQLYVWHDSCVMKIRNTCDVNHVCLLHMWRDSCVPVKHVTWLNYAWRDSCVIWIRCTCDVTQLYAWEFSYSTTCALIQISVTWLVCDVNRNDSHAPFFWFLLHQCRARSRIFEKKNQKISKTKNNTQKHTNTHRDPDTHTQTHTQTDRQTDTDTPIESERERHKRPMTSESSRGKKNTIFRFV